MESEEWVVLPDNRVSSNLVSEKETKRTSGIFARTLIPGKGKPLSDQAVISQDGKIVYVGSRSSIPSDLSDVPLKQVPVLMPGMVR